MYRRRLFCKEPLLVAVGIGICSDDSPNIVDRKRNRGIATGKVEQNKSRLNLGCVVRSLAEFDVLGPEPDQDSVGASREGKNIGILDLSAVLKVARA